MTSGKRAAIATEAVDVRSIPIWSPLAADEVTSYQVRPEAPGFEIGLGSPSRRNNRIAGKTVPKVPKFRTAPRVRCEARPLRSGVSCNYGTSIARNDAAIRAARSFAQK